MKQRICEKCHRPMQAHANVGEGENNKGCCQVTYICFDCRHQVSERECDHPERAKPAWMANTETHSPPPV